MLDALVLNAQVLVEETAVDAKASAVNLKPAAALVVDANVSAKIASTADV